MVAYRLREQFQEEISERINELDQLELAEEDLEPIFEEGVEIRDPELHRMNEMVGTSLHDTKRREPISVRLSLRDALEGSTSVITNAATNSPYLIGSVLLSAFTVIGLRRRHDVTPYQALTYGVGWCLVEDKDTVVEKDRLIDEVVAVSQDIDVVENMSRETVEITLQELGRMKCIDMEEADDTVLIWFREKFNVEYPI